MLGRQPRNVRIGVLVVRRVSEWLAATLEMWCPARGCGFESRALRFFKHVAIRFKQFIRLGIDGFSHHDQLKQACVKRSKRRRSTTSASAPAGNAKRKNGRLSAVCRSATKSGEAVCEVISHASPTSSIHVPTLETTDAIHSQRKSECPRGAQAESDRGEPFMGFSVRYFDRRYGSELRLLRLAVVC